jgi:selenocysteine-specific elongation factor
LRERAVSALRAFHAQVPDELGPDIGRLRRIAMPDSSDALWRALIDALVHERIVLRSAPWLHLPEHAMTLSEDDHALVRKLQPLIAAGRFDPPWVRDLAVIAHEPEIRVREVLRKAGHAQYGVSGRARSLLRSRVHWRACRGRYRNRPRARRRQRSALPG